MPKYHPTAELWRVDQQTGLFIDDGTEARRQRAFFENAFRGIRLITDRCMKHGFGEEAVTASCINDRLSELAMALKVLLPPNGWQPLDTAPRNATWVTGLLPDWTMVEMHWAQDLSGEDQPPFSGWFTVRSKDGPFVPVTPMPVAWRYPTEIGPGSNALPPAACYAKYHPGLRETVLVVSMPIGEYVYVRRPGGGLHFAAVDVLRDSAPLPPS